MAVEVPLTRGYVAVVDEEDLPKVRRLSWHANPRANTVYVESAIWDGERQKTIRLHRYLVDAPEAFVVDHINGNGLDNRRCNLRVCTTAQNAKNRTRLSTRNTSGVAGVDWNKQSAKWRAHIQVDKRSVYLGAFADKSDAIAARRAAELQYYGEFAPKSRKGGSTWRD